MMPARPRLCQPFLFLVCLFFVPAVYGQSGPASPKAEKKSVAATRKPNVIYIYADDMGYGELGVYGQKIISTPHIDRLANEGVRFTRHYTGAPVCAPARCMLMTGRHSGRSYIRGNYELGGFGDDEEFGQMPLSEGAYTVAKLMKESGYVTGMIGKWGLGVTNTAGDPLQHGFDYYYGYLDQKQAHNFYPTHLWENGRWDTLDNPYIFVHTKDRPKDVNDPKAFRMFQGKEYSLQVMADKTLDFIKKHRDNSFFLYLPYTGPHVSLQVPEQELKAYEHLFADDKAYFGDRGYASVRYPRATYAAMITYMDKQVGRILALLKELGLDENTLVMFSSDNGTTFDVGGVDAEFFNLTGGLRGRKQELYEGGIRVPFIARWPGHISAGRVSDHVSTQYDFLATMSELTGKSLPVGTDGISFLPSLTGTGRQQTHEFLYFEFPEKGGQVAVQIGRWKGVRSHLKSNKLSPWELYDLENDVRETRDVSSEHPELLRRMDEIVKREHRRSHVREWEIF